MELIAVSVKDETDRLIRSMGQIPRFIVPRAINAAINKTSSKVRTIVIREVAKETGLKQKEVRQFVSLRKSNLRTFTGIIRSIGRTLNLIRFNARQTKVGVSAKAWGVTRVYRGAFIANQGRTVFIRISRKRVPIRPLHGPSIPRTIINQKIYPAQDKVVRAEHPKNLRREFEFRIQKLRN